MPDKLVLSSQHGAFGLEILPRRWSQCPLIMELGGNYPVVKEQAFFYGILVIINTAISGSK